MKNLIIRIIYGVGIICVVGLSLITLFSSNEVANPDGMLPQTWRELSFNWLSIGSIPMMISSILMYRTIATSSRLKCLIFLPVIVPLSCAMYWIVILIFGYINMFLYY